MDWFKKASQSQKTHPDPWELTLAELRSYPLPDFKPTSETYVAFHLTPSANIDSILASGLRMSSARGKEYNEPNWVWAYIDKAVALRTKNAIITFKAPKNDPDVDQPNEITIRLTRSVPPEDILYAEKYYHITSRGASVDLRLLDFQKDDDPKLWHKLSVAWAIRQGLHVPTSVLNEYPNIGDY